jgi:hypothetical protein
MREYVTPVRSGLRVSPLSLDAMIFGNSWDSAARKSDFGLNKQRETILQAA